MTKQQEENLKPGDVIKRLFLNREILCLILKKSDIRDDYWCKSYELYDLSYNDVTYPTSLQLRDCYQII